MLSRIIVIGLFRISLPVRLEPRQGVISLRTFGKVKETEVRAEVEVEVEAEAEIAVEDLPTPPLIVEMKKKRRPSLVDCGRSIPCSFTPIPTNTKL